MKVLIAYSSVTGNTKQLADVIYNFDDSWDLMDINNNNNYNFNEYDLIFVGGWIDKGTFNTEVLKFIEFINNKNVSFFFTLGAYPTSMHAYNCIKNISDKLKQNNNCVISHFHWQGRVGGKIIEYMKTLPEVIRMLQINIDNYVGKMQQIILIKKILML